MAARIGDVIRCDFITRWRHQPRVSGVLHCPGKRCGGEWAARIRCGSIVQWIAAVEAGFVVCILSGRPRVLLQSDTIWQIIHKHHTAVRRWVSLQQTRSDHATATHDQLIQYRYVSLRYFLPARHKRCAGNSHHRVSVCVCVTRRYCIKTAKRRITQTTRDSPGTLVVWRQNSLVDDPFPWNLRSSDQPPFKQHNFDQYLLIATQQWELAKKV